MRAVTQCRLRGCFKALKYLVNVDRHVVLGLLVADISAAIDVSELVDVRRSELAGRDLVLEEKVELGIRASLWLGKAEIRPDDAKTVHASPGRVER